MMDLWLLGVYPLPFWLDDRPDLDFGGLGPSVGSLVIECGEVLFDSDSALLLLSD